MATIKRGILGGGSGSIANVVMTSWKGIGVIKSKPLSVANPKTAAQTTQRTKFTGIVNIAQYILSSVLQPVFNAFAQGMSGYNLFIQKNIDTAFSGGGIFQYDSLNISPKDGTTTPILTVTGSIGQKTLNATWATALPGADCMLTDLAYAVVTDGDGNVKGSKEPSAVRSAASITIPLTDAIAANDTFYVYLAFVSADKKRAFSTSYDLKEF